MEQKNEVGGLERILGLLADLESDLYYLAVCKDKAEGEGLKRDDVITVHALVNSALITWNDMIRGKKTEK